MSITQLSFDGVSFHFLINLYDLVHKKQYVESDFILGNLPLKMIVTKSEFYGEDGIDIYLKFPGANNSINSKWFCESEILVRLNSATTHQRSFNSWMKQVEMREGPIWRGGHFISWTDVMQYARENLVHINIQMMQSASVSYGFPGFWPNIQSMKHQSDDSYSNGAHQSTSFVAPTLNTNDVTTNHNSIDTLSNTFNRISSVSESTSISASASSKPKKSYIFQLMIDDVSQMNCVNYHIDRNWRVIFLKKSDSLSIFLCDKRRTRDESSILKVKCTIILYSLCKMIQPVVKQFEQNFSFYNDNCGFAHFIPWSILMNNYVHNDCVYIELQLEFEFQNTSSLIIDEKPSRLENYNNHLECPICLISTIGQKPAITKCGHLFCSECIEKSIKNQNLCPCCCTHNELEDLRRIFI